MTTQEQRSFSNDTRLLHFWDKLATRIKPITHAFSSFVSSISAAGCAWKPSPSVKPSTIHKHRHP